MKEIDHNNVDELNSCIERSCKIKYKVIPYPNEYDSGILTKIEFNDRTGKLRIQILRNDNKILIIPTDKIISFEVEE